ncbi:MAG: T9SS type A sorting domain-containing protein [Paludibacteraceae bacterium]|nr:T9SS type A sorting domain-containing protein [Paludibacteraceae bacterium]
MRKLSTFFLFVLFALIANTMDVGAQVEYKLSETFDGITAGIPAGWDNSDGTTFSDSYKWTYYATGAGTTGHCVRFDSYYNSNGNTNMLKTPAMDLSTGAWILKFKFKNPTGGDFSVFISTDGGATYATPLLTGLTGQANWTEREVSLSSYANGSSNVKIVFQGTSNYGSPTQDQCSIYLDDVTVESAPTCKSPTGLAVSNLSRTGATLTWGLSVDGSIPATYIYTLTDADGNVIEQNAALTAPSLQYAIATQLTPNTTYTASLRGDCTSEYQGSSNVATVTFTTLCDAQSAPYTQNFDALTKLPECTFSTNASISTSGQTGKGLALSTTVANSAYIVFPEVTLQSDAVEMTFFIKASSTYQGSTKFSVGLMSDPTDDSSFEMLYADSLTSSAWREIRMNTSATAYPVTNTAFLCIYVMSGYDNTVIVDDLSIHAIPSCVRPENPVVLSCGADNVTLDWSVTNATNVRVYATNMSDQSVVTALASQHPFTMTGLMPETNYSFALRGICSVTDSSEISNSVSVKTRCAVAESTVFLENAETTIGSGIPNCWETGFLNRVSSSTVPPFQSQTSTKIGNRGFVYNNTTSGSIAYLCSKPLNFDQAGKYSFRFQMNRRSGNYYVGEGLKVFVTPNVGDTTNAVEVIPFVSHYAGNSPAGIAGWNEYEGVINYQGTGYIMIVGYTKNGYSIYFDDLQVMLTPTCFKVSDIAVGNYTQSSADITWTSRGNENQWLVDYEVRQGQNVVASATDSIVSGQPMATVTGLSAGTAYTITATVRAYCGVGDTAEAVQMTSRSFSTMCNLLNTLPYSCGFEATEVVAYEGSASHQMPLCWSRLNDAYSNDNFYPYASTTSVSNSRTGTGCLDLYYDYDADDAEHAIAIMNQIDVNSIQISNMRMKFYAKAGTASYQFPIIVGMMSNISDIATFDAIDTLYVSNYEGFDCLVAPFTNYTGSGTFPAIMVPGTKSTSIFGSIYGHVYVDDLSLEVIPSCLELNGSATVSDITENSAKVTLDDATAVQGWSYAYDVAGTPADEMAAYDTTGAFVVLNGLAPATTYDLYVRRHCGNEYGAWSSKVSFITGATPAQMPYVCSFENDAETAGWMFVDGAGSNVFTIGTASAAVADGSSALYVTDNRLTKSYTYNTGSSTQAYAYRSMHFDAKGYQIEFKFKSTGGEGAWDFGRIFLTAASVQLPAGNTGSGLNSTTFPNIAEALDADFVASGSTIPQLNVYTTSMGSPDADGWHTVSYFVDMTNRPGNYNLVLMWSNDASAGASSYPLSIDDINIYELTCIPPSTILIDDLTSTGATVNIQQNDASQWEVVVNNQPFATESIPADVIYRSIENSNEVVLTGLTPNTIYYYAIRTICGVGDTSKWSAVASFHTFCSTYDVPYLEDYEGESSVDCWSNINPAVGSVSRSISYHRSGISSMKIESAQVVSPELNVTTLAPFMMNAWYYATEDSVQFSVGIMTDPNDVSSFEVLSTEMIPAKNTWTELTTYFSALNDPDYSDYLNAKYIVIATSGGNIVYVDDLLIDSIPTCPKPTEVRISNVTAHSFDISFTDNAGASQWIVYTNGASDTINSNPATVSGLAAATTFMVEIAAVCGDETSYTTACGNVRTACDAIGLPYVCGFEQSEGFTYSGNYLNNYVEGAIEAGCWSSLNASSSYPSYVIANDDYRSAGNQGLKMFSSSSYYLYMVMPVFDVQTPTMNVIVKFKARVENEGSSGIIELGYLTDPASESSWVGIYTAPRTNSFTAHEVAVTNVPATARLAFRYGGGNCYDNYYAGIDEVEIKEIRSCSDPYTPTISNLTYSSVDIAFIDTCAAHQNWEYVYGPAASFNANALTPQAITTTSFHLSDLTEDMEYKVAVRAICGAGDESNWIIVPFHTFCLPFTVTMTSPYLDSFEDAENNAEYGNVCYLIDGKNSYTSYGYTTYYSIMGKANDLSSQYSHYYYATSGDKCLNPYVYPTYTPNGLSLVRQFHFEAGKVYKVKIFAGSTTTTGNNTLKFMLGTTSDAAGMRTLEQHTVAGRSNSYTPGTPSIMDYRTIYDPYETYMQIDSTGDYYLAVNFNTDYQYGGYFYADEFSVEESSSCMPTNYVISQTTETSAEVTMDDQNPTHSWEYVVTDQALDTVATGVITSNPYTINGLMASSSYTINVRQLCGVGETSEWKTKNFRTACGTSTLPYVCGFEANEGFQATSSFVPGIAETACWDVLNTTTDGYSIPYYYITNSPSRVMGGTQAFEFHGAASSSASDLDIMAIMPAFDQPTGSLLVNFDAMYESTSACGDLEFGYITNPTNIHTWTSLYTVPRNTASATIPVEVDLTQFAGVPDNARLAIRYGKAMNTNYYAWIDNFNVRVCPSCREPQYPGVVSSTTMTTMTVEVPMGNKPAAQVACAVKTPTTTAEDIDMSTAVTTTTGVATLTGLIGSTTYAVYYRYVCGENDWSDWSPMCIGTTTEDDCFAPQNLRIVGILDDHHVELTWGKAPDATSFEWELRKGANTIASGDTAAALIDTMRFDTLQAVSSYTFRVRSICGNVDTSEWTALSFATTHTTYPVPFVCNFETIDEQTMWNMMTFNGLTDFVIGTAESNGGNYGMYASYNGGSSASYTSNVDIAAVTLLTMPAGNYLINYDWKCAGESSWDNGTAYLVPSSTTLTAANCQSGSIPADAIKLMGNMTYLVGTNSWQTQQSIVQITNNGVYQLVFTFHSDGSNQNDPSFCIDNVNVQALNCMPVTSVVNVSTTSYGAKYVVTRNTAAHDIQYGYSTDDSENDITWTTVQGGALRDTITLAGLTPRTTYYFYVREVCGDDNVSAATRSVLVTPSVPQTMPFICGFEASETTTDAWQFANSTNGFTVGSAASSVGSQSMYITDDGTAWHYVQTPSTSCSYAYVPLAFGDGTYEISYDWQAKGESNYDYARVYLAPASFIPTANVTESGIYTSGAPTDWIAIDGDAKLNDVTDWQSVFTELSFTDSMVMNMVVYWQNDVSGDYQPPFAIDNISIVKQTCPSMPFDSLSLESVSETSVTVRFYNPNEGAQTMYVLSSNSQFTDTIAFDTLAAGVRTFTVDGLTAGTMYYCSLYSLCEDGYISRALKVNVRTACSVITQYPYNEDFEGFEPQQYNLLTGVCWLTTEMSSAKYAVAATDANYVHSGNQGLYVNNGYSYYDTPMQILALPEMDVLNGKYVSFWHKAYDTGTSFNTMNFGYLDAIGQFVSLTQFTDKATNWQEYTTTLKNIPVGVSRLAFQFVGTYYYYLDDIHVNSVYAADTIYETVCYSDGYSGHGVTIPASQLTVGENIVSRMAYSTVAGEQDTLFTLNINKLANIATTYYDTICAGQPYNKGEWRIANPVSQRYFTTIANGSVAGCDSTVELFLTVLPTRETRFDTICQGDVYMLDTMHLTQTGVYTAYTVNRLGCNDTVTLNLYVVDSVVTTNAAICQGQYYDFEGQRYTVAGTYRVTTVGAHGCTVNKVLNLTVYETDSIITVSFCHGGSVQVVDTTINTPGTYTLVRVNPMGCDVTYHITATEDALIPVDVYDIACEGHTYTGYGVSDLNVTSDTVVVITGKTIDAKCDSITNVHLTFTATVYSDTSVTIQPGETFTWNNNTYSETGDYPETLQSVVTGCDSIATLHLKVNTGVDNVSDVNMSIVPNPVNAGATAFVYGEFGEVEKVEILSNFGQIVETFVPDTYPIEVSGISASGLYYVRVTTKSGSVHLQKLIVK